MYEQLYIFLFDIILLVILIQDVPSGNNVEDEEMNVKFFYEDFSLYCHESF